jgi:ferredoxin-type protein NapG
MACVICENLSCMYHCPSGAILPVPREQINMGLAVWHDHLCVRHNGTECTICVDKCPIGATAIRLSEGRIEVLSPGCTGCGVCQHECPTTPKSITITPRSAMGNGHDGPNDPEARYTD